MYAYLYAYKDVKKAVERTYRTQNKESIALSRAGRFTHRPHSDEFFIDLLFLGLF